jgi:F-type H+-transporting ATPase subunit gamma
MPGGQERILRRRIRSVQSTKKITRAFELIAASQIVRAQNRLAGSRPYVEGIARALAIVASEVGAAGAPSGGSGTATADAAGAGSAGQGTTAGGSVAAGSIAGRLVGDGRDARRVLVVVIVADRGLAGGYNAFGLRAADRLMRDGEGSGRSYRLVAVGRKAQAYFRFRGRQVERVFLGMTDRPRFEDARQVAAEVVRPFLAGEVDLVQLVSWRFRSAGLQTVETRQLLPLPASAVQHAAGSDGAQPGDGGAGGAAGSGPGLPSGSGASGSDAAPALSGTATGTAASSAAPGPVVRPGASYEFEPDPAELLTLLVPQYAEAEIFRALLEASASEHTARQRAMAAATENADELITTYRRQMNRARQESITTEIMEIVGGAEALRQGARHEQKFTFDPATLTPAG